MDDTNPFASPELTSGPQLQIKKKNKLEGIGGWLILVCIHLILSIFLNLAAASVAIFVLFGQATRDVVWNSASEHYRPGLAGMLVMELMVFVGMLLFTCYLIVTMFRKQSSFPKLMIAFYGLQPIFVLADMAWASAIGLDTMDNVQALIRSVVACGIWIPYMRVSKRVKATFVHPLPDDQGDTYGAGIGY